MKAPLVLVHAFPFGPDLWSPVVAHLEADATWHQPVVVPALPGFAHTALPDAPPDLAVVATQLVDHVIEPLGSASIIVAGVSLGGYVAMAVARQRPDLLAGLILIDTKATADATPAREGRLLMAEQAEREPSAVGELLIQQLLPKLLGVDTQRYRPEVVAMVRSWLSQAPPASVAWYQRAMAQRVDSLDVLRSLQVPALVVYGDQDELSPPLEQDHMVEALPNVRRMIIQGSGHLTPLENPAELARGIATFVTTSISSN